MFHQVFAQSNGTLRFTRYGIEEGIQNKSIGILGQDSTGFIWLSSPLTRFDGNNFKTYLNNPEDPSSGFIEAFSMTDDGKGNLFFAGKMGVYYFDPALDHPRLISPQTGDIAARRIIKDNENTFFDVRRSWVTKIKLPGFETESFQIPNWHDTLKLLAVKGHKDLWFSKKGERVFRYILKTQTLKTYFLPKGTDGLDGNFATDKQGNIWLLTAKDIWKFNQRSEQFEWITTLPKLNKKDRWCTLGTVFIPGQDHIWILREESTTVLKFNLKNQTLDKFHIENVLKNAKENLAIYIGLALNPDQLVIGTINSGMFWIDAKSGKVRQFTSSPENTNSLESNSVKPMLQTSDDVFWVCGMGQGLVKCEWIKPTFKTYFPPVQEDKIVFHRNIRFIANWNQNTLLIGSIKGVELFDIQTNTFKPLPMPQKLYPRFEFMGAKAFALSKDRNLLVINWTIDESRGIHYFNYQNNELINLSKAIRVTFEESFSLLLDSKQRFWIPTKNGIYIVPDEVLKTGDVQLINNASRFISYSQILDEKSGGTAVSFSIVEDPAGFVWVGTSRGLMRINVTDYSSTFFKSSFNKPQSIKSDNIRATLIDHKGQLWVGTQNGGLSRLNYKNGTFETYQTPFLPDNTIYSLAEDGKGNLWMGTNKGLCCFDPEAKKILKFGLSDGIQDYEFNSNSVCKTSNGSLAFGGINGFNFFNPDSLNLSLSSPKILISEFKVNNRSRSINQSNIDLTYTENFISLDISALSFFNSNQNTFAWRMDGIDENWIMAGKNHVAFYNGLSPGNYTFRAKAANQRGIWSEIALVKHIHISPPFWETWWFRAIAILCVIGLFYAFYRYRLQQTIKMMQLRDKIAIDLHDEIGSSLNSIAFFSEAARQMIPEDAQANHVISRINDKSKEIMESMSDIVWSLNSRNDSFDNIFNRLQSFAFQMLEPQGCQIEFDIPEQNSDMKLGMEERKNLYLLIKEAINNAAKYASCSQFLVSVRKNIQGYRIEIQDNGKGFDPENITKGNGLMNMQKRAKDLRADFEIESSPGIGTRILVDLKFS